MAIEMMNPMLDEEEAFLSEGLVEPPMPIEDDSHEEIEKLVTYIVTQADTQERPSREILIQLWKRLDLLWHGVNNYYWNAQLSQYRPITYEDLKGVSESVDFDPTLLDKTINLIRPYGESLIGVQTTILPKVKFFPANADNVEDIRTAKVSSVIEKRIVDDNFMKIKVIEIIVKLWNGGFAAAYNYTHTSPEYGTFEEDIVEDKTFETTEAFCPNCGNGIYSEENEVVANSLNVESGLDEAINSNVLPVEVESSTCMSCGMEAPPMMDVEQETRSIKTGVKSTPKTRQLINIYGPLNVKIPAQAKRKEEVFWLILEEEIHEAHAKSLYPAYHEKIRGGDTSADTTLDRYARSQYESMGETGIYYVTMRKVWMRPSAYWMLKNEEEVNTLKAKYPDGLVAVFAGDTFLFCDESVMDEHWTLSFNPLYDRMYGDPLGKALIPLQEVANEIYQLKVETFKHSIPQMFADPKVVDFEAYRQSEAKPGQLYPFKSENLTKPASEYFFESRSAVLPKEVDNLDAQNEKLFQFISGVLPSVFGGPAAGSKTLGEYEQSRNQALQRIGLVWLVVNVLYAECMAKAVKAYRKGLLEDEYIVESKGDGSFINTWIRKADSKGEVGKVVPEIGEQFPASWAQKKAGLLELIGLNNQMIQAILFHPENAHMLSTYLGMDEMYVPGDEQRNKQLSEIAKMVSSAKDIESQMMEAESQGLPPIDPMMIPPPTIPINSAIDDHAIHSTIGKAYLCSLQGEELQEQMPLAYQAIMMHVQEHDNYMAMLQAQAEAKAAQMQQNNDNQIGEVK